MALFSRIHTWVSNETLTAADLNAEFNNILNNAQATSLIGYSANQSQMQSVVDPGDVGTESLASNISGEIQRLRFAVKRIIGQAQWYSAAPSSRSLTNIVIGTADLVDASVTVPKLAAANYGFSSNSSSGTFTFASVTFTGVAVFTRTLTGRGRGLKISLEPGTDGSGAINGIEIVSTATANVYFSADIQLLRDGAELAVYELKATTASATVATKHIFPVSSLHFDDAAITDTSAHTYTVNVRCNTNCSTVSFINCRLLVQEKF